MNKTLLLTAFLLLTALPAAADQTAAGQDSTGPADAVRVAEDRAEYELDAFREIVRSQIPTVGECEECEEIFSAIDSNGDGVIIDEEIQAYGDILINNEPIDYDWGPGGAASGAGSGMGSASGNLGGRQSNESNEEETETEESGD